MAGARRKEVLEEVREIETGGERYKEMEGKGKERKRKQKHHSLYLSQDLARR